MKIKQVIDVTFKSENRVTNEDINDVLEELQTTYIIYQILETFRLTGDFENLVFMKLLVEDRN